MKDYWTNGRKLQEYLPKLSDAQKRLIQDGRKIKVCEEQREGWLEKIPFYIFWCEACENFAYDYPHGHIEIQHLNCHRCGEHVGFVPWWVPWHEAWLMLRTAVSWKFGGGK